MPYLPKSETAVHALDEVQILATQKQYSWLSGADVITTGSTSSIETAVSSGRCVFNGEQITIPGGNHTHPAGDTDNPRWDALVVTDRDGTVEVFTGVPAPTVTDDNGEPIRGEAAFSPAPSDNITSEMVCLALVWIPSGATNNDDLTDTSVGGVAEPVVDRRVYQAGKVNQTTRRATISSSGWFTIASQAPLGNGPDTPLKLANGLFTVRDTQAGRTSAMSFWASHLDAEQPTIRVLNSSAGSAPRAIQGVRIVSGQTESDDGAEVQINVQLNSDSSVSIVEYTLQNNYHYGGWYPESWQTGTTPTGYDSTDVYWRGSGHVEAISTDHAKTARYSVDRDGNASMRDINRDKVAVKVELSSDQSIPNGSVTEVAFDSVVFDDYGASNGSGITVPVDGVYQCASRMDFGTLDDGSYATMILNKNGTNFARVRQEPLTGNVTLENDTIAQLSENDTLTASLYYSSSSSVDVHALRYGTFLSLTRLG